jgi:hypothetical protein
MKFQFLPHYFKYIGLVMVLVYYCTDFANGFYRGFTGQPYESSYSRGGDTTQLINYPDFIPANLFTLIGYTGFLVYILAKDKLSDEFVIQKRLESAYIVFIGTLIFLILVILLNWDFSAIYLFEVQVLLYLIINKVRRYI